MRVTQQFSSDYVLSELLSRIENSTQRQVATELGITPQFLNDIIKERREISVRVAKALGYKRRIIFERAK